MRPNTRGAIPAIYLAVLLVVGVIALIPHFHVPAFLLKKPATVQLSKEDDAVAKAKADQAKAEAALAAAKAAQDAQTLAQTRMGQQMAYGAAQALSVVPAEHVTSEVTLAKNLLARSGNALDAAIGKLPADQQTEMRSLVTEALSKKQAEVDAANTALAAKDAELRATVAQKDALSVQIPALTATLQTKTAEVAAHEAARATAEAKVVDWANKKADADAKAGSLDAYAGNLAKIILLIGLGWLFKDWILPSLAQEFSGCAWLQAVDKTVKSVTSARA